MVMDTGINSQGGVVSSGSCYLMIPEIKGDWEVGSVIKDGHAVIEYALGASKAVVPANNGMDLQSARALGTLFTMTLQTSPHQHEILAASAKGTNIPKIIIINLKNHGVTADEVFRIELTNVKFREVRLNRKRKMGGYSHNPTVGKINQEKGVGYALDANPNQFAQAQDPNFVTQLEDVYEVDCAYSTVMLVHTPTKETGELDGGHIPGSFDFIHNTTEIPSS
jgi:hypothetical protein